jgi:hypothetical protein
MLCEECSRAIETVTCSSCGSQVLALGRFCYCCGSSLSMQEGSVGTTEGPVREGPPDAIDFSTRLLCSDGACIGVVNEHGLCKVCGKPYVPES